MDMTTPVIMAKLDEIAQLEVRRAELYRELRRSVVLSTLWHDAFEGSQNPTVQVSGNPRQSLSFTIYNGNETKTFALEDVPFILWPEAVVNDIRRLGHHAMPVYRKLLQGEDNATNQSGH